MDISLFWRGLVMGVAIAAPVGPIGVLCICQPLTHGLLTGLVSLKIMGWVNRLSGIIITAFGIVAFFS